MRTTRSDNDRDDENETVVTGAKRRWETRGTTMATMRTTRGEQRPGHENDEGDNKGDDGGGHGL